MQDPELPHTFRVMRKACRWFAGIWLLFAVVTGAAAIVDAVKHPEDRDAWVSMVGILACSLPAYLIWKIPDWLIGKYETHLTQALEDPTKEVHTKTVVTTLGTFEHVEITERGSRETYVTEDRRGRVIFDNTKRPMRVLFGGGFLVIGLIIGGLIFAFEDDIGFFEYTFVGGWITYCLIAMGFVHEVTIQKSLGTAERKAGWFVFVVTHRFRLLDFSRVVVESTFYRQRHDMIKDRYESEEPKFRVTLVGKRELNLRVFSSLTDARHMGEDVAAYLHLPLEEKNEIQV